MRTDFGPDQPGANTKLNPGQAPRWMRRLVSEVPAAHSHPDVRGVDACMTNREGPDRSAAVLILFSGADHFAADPPGNAAVLLTHRSPSMRSHSGQIAFPGGRVDSTDLNPVDAALREAWEETGLDRSTVTPVAEMEPVHIRASGYPVHPVLGRGGDAARRGGIGAKVDDGQTSARLERPPNAFEVADAVTDVGVGVGREDQVDGAGRQHGVVVERKVRLDVRRAPCLAVGEQVALELAVDVDGVHPAFGDLECEPAREIAGASADVGDDRVLRFDLQRADHPIGHLPRVARLVLEERDHGLGIGVVLRWAVPARTAGTARHSGEGQGDHCRSRRSSHAARVVAPGVARQPPQLPLAWVHSSPVSPPSESQLARREGRQDEPLRRSSPTSSRTAAGGERMGTRAPPIAAETDEGAWPIRAWRTLFQILVRPAQSFRVCPEPVDHGRVMKFLATLRLPPWLVLVGILGYRWASATEPSVQPMRSIYAFIDPPIVQALSSWIVLMVPVGLPLLYFFAGLLAHIGIALTGGAPRSIGASMRAVGYTLGPALLLVGLLDLPLYLSDMSGELYLSIVAVVALVFLVQAGVALARTHQIGLARGLMVALVPMLVLSSVTLGRAVLELRTVPGLPVSDVAHYIP